jgi:hypothetical protein
VVGRKKKRGYAVLLILSIVFTLAAVKTALPSDTASHECLVGYKSYCTFTPVSTVILLVLAGACFIILRRAFTIKE